MESLRTLGSALALAWRARPGASVGLAAVTVVEGLVPIGLAWATKLVVDAVAMGSGGLAVAAVLLVAFTAAGLLAPAAGRYWTEELVRGIGLAAQDQLFVQINALPGLAAFEDPAFHDAMRMAQQGGELAPGQLVTVGASLGQAAVTLAGFVVALVVVSPLIAVLVLAALVPALTAELRLARERVRSSMALSPQERRRLFYSVLQTDPDAAKELRLFGLGEHFRGRMRAEYERIAREERRLDRRGLRMAGLSGALTALVTAAALVLLMRQASSGGASAGDVVVALAALAAVQATSGALVAGIADASQGLLLLGYYRRFVASRPTVARARAAPPLRSAIELRNVWFRYDEDGPWVLRGVDLVLERGTAVALVGLNGAGKSTVVKLLCRFYDPSRGAILWEGIDLRELDPSSLRKRLGAVFQDFMQYDLSARENVGLGDVAALGDLARIEAAARRAEVHEPLAALPRGYDTMLSRIFSEDVPAAGNEAAPGTMLSGGLWQRVALARLFMRGDRDLLILDEPSAGLDVDAEHLIHRRFREQMQDTTSLLVSHRFNTVRMADVIVVLDGGQVVESGSHEALLAAKGNYAHMFERQAAGYRG
jgi:ATP-binding cassette, subfamily B, bacterial